MLTSCLTRSVVTTTTTTSRLLTNTAKMTTDIYGSALRDMYREGRLQLKSSTVPLYKLDQKLNNIIRIYQGDITKLKIDAIQNAANERLQGGGGIDAAIHNAAGKRELQKMEKEMYPNGAKTGEAVITPGLALPARNIIHTVGPIYDEGKGDRNRQLLESCYMETLKCGQENGCKSIAFCCVSTGIYGYPNEDAAHVALKTTREYLDGPGKDNFTSIIFCIFLDVDLKHYQKLAPLYFPPTEADLEELKIGKAREKEGEETK